MSVLWDRVLRLRPLAYSTLADLVHHVRQHLPLNDLSLAVQLFAKNIDDESLPSSIQTMSCKLLLNLVDCIRSKSEQENGNEAQFIPNKQLQPKETQIYIKLVKYAMQALDIYQVQIAGNGQTYVRVANCQTVRMKEEKEVLEHFAGVFTMMNPLTFKEIFQTTVPYMVERISKNYALQIVANSFLANPTTSALFATILVEYLLDRLPEMGSNVELSNLYLKLFNRIDDLGLG
ncbi:transformation transcription domain-associated protein [Limosa lapponica baueri]|uniref:Transformation transcription domain-associated protein n=1 Tax=Limosa lapponica baueri TaxID=1758121 RepID=A0A2I0TII3_LIMLA|nr:transformation transcription domain-associated protein [Limosa lapponica baueri]